MVVDVVDDLVGVPSVVVEDVVLLCPCREGDLLDEREDVGQVLVGELVRQGGVELGDDEGVSWSARGRVGRSLGQGSGHAGRR